MDPLACARVARSPLRWVPGKRHQARLGSGSSPYVERVACGSSRSESGAVTVSLYLAESSVRTRGTGSHCGCSAGLLSRRTPIAAAPARARRRRDRAGSAGWSRECLRSTLGQPWATFWLRSQMAHALPQGGSSAKWLVGSCEGDACGRRRRVPGRPGRSRRGGGAPSSRLSSASGPRAASTA